MRPMREAASPRWTVEIQEGRAGWSRLVRCAARPVFFSVFSSIGKSSPANSSRMHADLLTCVSAVILACIDPDDVAPPSRSLTVAICTKDRPELVERCIRSLKRLNESQAFAILVVDNAPSDGRTAQVAKTARVHYIVEPRAGLDFARNRALKTATTDWLAFIDDDAVADGEWLDGLRRAWCRYPDAKGITGFVLPYALDTPAQVIFEVNGGFRRGVVPICFDPEIPHDPFHPCNSGRIGAGCNMAFDRFFILDIGGFDEALDTGRPLPGGGDLDIFCRVLHAGGTMAYEPNMIVRHEHRSTMDQLRRQYWSWGLGFMAFLDKTKIAQPSLRSRANALTRWWVKYMIKRFAKRVLRGQGVPVSMILAELLGGIQGYFGEYGRSVRRSEKIRQNG